MATSTFAAGVSGFNTLPGQIDFIGGGGVNFVTGRGASAPGSPTRES